MPFERALAVAELAFGVADLPNLRTIEESNRLDEFVDGVAVRPGVAVDRAADPAGDSGHGMQAAQSRRDGRVHQVLQHGSGSDANHRGINLNRTLRVPEYKARKPGIFGNQVAAAADQGMGFPQRGDQRGFRGRVREYTRRSSDREPRVPAQRSVFQNL